MFAIDFTFFSRFGIADAPYLYMLINISILYRYVFFGVVYIRKHVYECFEMNVTRNVNVTCVTAKYSIFFHSCSKVEDNCSHVTIVKLSSHLKK